MAKLADTTPRPAEDVQSYLVKYFDSVVHYRNVRDRLTERRAEIAERQLEAALRQMDRPPRPERRTNVRTGAVHEHHDMAGICRVCGQPAPPQSAARQDELRVCRATECRQEARRRDNNAKQRRARERQRG